MNVWRIKITTHLKNTILSLFPAQTSRVIAPRRRTAPATSITRIQAGFPHAAPVVANGAHAAGQRRSVRQFPTYTRGSYLSHTRHDVRRRQPIFRIG